MTATAPREYAAAVLFDTTGRLLLQQRDDKPDIVQPGKIGLFGGSREEGESDLQCVIREVWEETNYVVPPERLEYLGIYEGTDIAVPEGVRVVVFIVRDVPVNELTVTEGSLRITEIRELEALKPKLVPVAAWALDLLFANK